MAGTLRTEAVGGATAGDLKFELGKGRLGRNCLDLNWWYAYDLI